MNKSNEDTKTRRHEKIWLICGMVCVALMVMIGGATRLTESGLSIVEWKLFSGIFPPLNEELWLKEFAAYKTSPEFQRVNSYMELSDFKCIFWLEYLHRLMGRITGLMIILPYLLFFRKLDKHMKKRGLIISALVILQGVVGWFMVKSGLIDNPNVSAVRLALHLSAAFLLFQVMWFSFLQSCRHCEELCSEAIHEARSGLLRYARNDRARKSIIFITILISLQIIFGAFVAGLDAGKTYNTFPLMDGDFIPGGLFTQSPIYLNFIHNIITVQFQHRMLAFIVFFAVVYAYIKFRKTLPQVKYLLRTTILQFALGVVTLIYAVPIIPALLHQIVALMLLSICVYLLYNTKKKAN